MAGPRYAEVLKMNTSCLQAYWLKETEQAFSQEGPVGKIFESKGPPLVLLLGATCYFAGWAKMKDEAKHQIVIAKASESNSLPQRVMVHQNIPTFSSRSTQNVVVPMTKSAHSVTIKPGTLIAHGYRADTVNRLFHCPETNPTAWTLETPCAQSLERMAETEVGPESRHILATQMGYWMCSNTKSGWVIRSPSGRDPNNLHLQM